MSDNDNLDTTVSDNPAQNRYEIHLGGELAGFAGYTLSGAVIDFTHTEIFEKFGGRGLAKTLAAESLDDVRTRDLAVLPTCALYQRFIAKNEPYADLVPADRRAEYELA